MTYSNIFKIVPVNGNNHFSFYHNILMTLVTVLQCGIMTKPQEVTKNFILNT